MKDVFNKRQRFSLRKYSVGVCSVLLGTALFAAGANTASAEETTASSGASTSASTESASDSTAAETVASSTEASYNAPVTNVDQANTSAAKEVSEQSEANKAAEKAEEVAKPAKAEETAKQDKTEEAAKPAKAEETAKPAPKAEAPKATATPEAKKADEKSQAHSAASEAAKPAASTSTATSESSEAASASEAAAVALKPTAQPASLRGTEAPAAELAAAADRSATLDRAATDLTNAGALATSRSRRGRRALTDHNNEPVAVTTFLKDGEVATPEMTDPNGASVSSQTVPAGYQAKEGDFYTYAIWDLTEFNKRYGTTYYARAYKRFDDSTDTTVELINKNTGSVVETRTITASSGVQKFTTTTAASNSQLTFQVDYKAGTAPTGKKAEPFIQNGYAVGKSITDLVASGHQLTPAEQALYTAVYNARTTTDILNVVEPAYNGRTITDSNAKIPVTINKTTYYKVVDKNNPTFNANKTDKTVQDYKENGNEVELA